MNSILKFSLFLFVLGFAMVSCKNDANKAEVSEATEVAAAVGNDFKVDPSLSKVMWEGYKPAGTHNGTLNVANGSISVKDGAITGGEFVLDMKSITVLDLEGDSKQSLESHLKGTGDEAKTDDFFNVTAYPTAKFEITKVTNLENNPDATHLVYGNLTLKDITQQVGIQAKIDITEDAVKVTTPKFTINRTGWGIKFMSKSFMDNLKDNFINDEIGLTINLVARG